VGDELTAKDRDRSVQTVKERRRHAVISQLSIVRRCPTAVTLLLPVALLVAACTGGRHTPATTNGSSVNAAKVADRSATLSFATNASFGSLDPIKSTLAVDPLFQQPMYERLLTVVQGANGLALGPQLAKSFTVAPDGRSIAFELRNDVRFQDGTRFDAAAVKANIERAQGPTSLVASKLKEIQTVEVKDDVHVVIHLNGPDSAFGWTLATGTVGMMVSPAAFNTDLLAKPDGTGPFTLAAANKDTGVTYQRWAEYRDKDAALVQQLKFVVVRDTQVRFNGLRSGQYDVAFLASPTDAAAKSLTAQGYHYEQGTIVSYGSYGVMLNTGKPPFDDARVRRAVSLAIDRSQISTKLLSGINPPSYQPLQQGVIGYDPSLDKNPVNLDEARTLVRAAGAEGATVTVIEQTNPPNDAIATVVQQALGDIGLKVKLVPFSPVEGTQAWSKGAYNASVGLILSSAEPSRALALYLASDPSSPPADLVAMVNKAKALPPGSAEQRTAYQVISRYLTENPLHVPIASFVLTDVARPKVVGADRLQVRLLDQLEFRGVGIAK
jgi:peptide/nickel transport system substrate-binding protein